jgi:glycosyltransferase involved in cell wall biosynthesis
VAVCTRGRADSLSGCLGSLLELDYPIAKLDLLVVDNASEGDATGRCVRTKSPRIRCVREPRPGFDWARNRAALESHADIVAYTDDGTTAAALCGAFVPRPPSSGWITDEFRPGVGYGNWFWGAHAELSRVPAPDRRVSSAVARDRGLRADGGVRRDVDGVRTSTAGRGQRARDRPGDFNVGYRAPGVG